MKKTWVALGLIILIVGLAITVWPLTFQRKVVTYRYTYETRNQWNVTGEFIAGNRLNLSITPGANWGAWAEPADQSMGFLPGTGILEIYLDIVGPTGGKTNFAYLFIAAPGQEGLTPQVEPFGGRVLSNDGGLTIETENYFVKIKNDTYYRSVGGTVKYNGTYTAALSQDPVGTPRHLELRKEEVATELPYFFMVPIGGTITGSGIALSAWASKKPKHRPSRRDRKPR